MKKLLVLMTLGMFLQCTSQKSADLSKTAEIAENMEFTFHAKKAILMSTEIQSLGNTIPNYTPARMSQLDNGYRIVIDDKKLDVALPYFGQVYSGHISTTSGNRLNFTSDNFSVDKSINKKGNTILVFMPKDVKRVRSMTMEIFKNGNASVAVEAHLQQPITFDGYIAANEEAGQ